MAQLDRITITGADESVDPEKLVDLALRWPIVELAILFGTHDGRPRFPSMGWVRKLRGIVMRLEPSRRPRMAAHLCGMYVRDFLTRDRPRIPLPEVWGRLQINTHAEPHLVNLGSIRKTLEILNGMGIQVVFQLDGVNEDLFHWARGMVLGSREWAGRLTNVAGLYDLSHGAGVLPATWPAPIPGAYLGYAGGLSPENVVLQLDKIYREAFPTDFWIDAETGLRSGNGSVFDLERVEEFVRSASRWLPPVVR